VKKAQIATVAELPSGLLKDIRALIEETRQQTAVAVNAGLTLLYWRMGQRIHTEVLGNERATYGEQIVATLSRQLVAEYGRGFAEKNLRRMTQFAQAYPDEKIVVTLLRQLSWSHFLALIPLEKPFQRDFYAEKCRIERWSYTCAGWIVREYHITDAGNMIAQIRKIATDRTILPTPAIWSENLTEYAYA
jgi:hypothetical protein